VILLLLQATPQNVPVTSAIQWVALGVQILALCVLAYFGKKCLDSFNSAMTQKAPGVETSWGGLGGSLGGWRASRSLVWLILMLATLAAFAAIATQVGENRPSNGAQSSSVSDSGKQQTDGGKTGSSPEPSTTK